jgi:hypothetical protein
MGVGIGGLFDFCESPLANRAGIFDLSGRAGTLDHYWMHLKQKEWSQESTFPRIRMLLRQMEHLCVFF